MKKLVALAVANSCAIALAGILYNTTLAKTAVRAPCLAHATVCHAHTVIVTFGTKV